MKRIVFFSIPLFGHVNYGLKIAKRLKKCGYDVVYYSGFAYKKFIEKAEVTFHSYSKEIEQLFSYENSTYNNEYMQYVHAEELNHISEWYKFCHHLYTITDIFMRVDIAEMKSPDLVVYDSAALWGRYVSKYFKIKSVASCTPYTYIEEYVYMDLNRFSKLIFQENLSERTSKRLIYVLNHRLNYSFLNISPCSILEPLDPKSDYKLIYTVKEFQAGSEYMDSNTTFFCGIMQENDMISVDYTKLICKNGPNIYIAFGSIYNNASIFNKIFESCKYLNFNFILNIGTTINPNTFANLPDNWKIVQSLNQVELLKYMDIFISHGGVNSVREAMHQGVPIIILPTEGDTFCTAEDIRENKLGVVLSISDINMIGTVIEKLIQNEIIKNNCKKLSHIMQSSIGLNGVVDIIENILRS